MCSLKPGAEFPATAASDLVGNYWDELLLDNGKAAVFNIWLQISIHIRELSPGKYKPPPVACRPAGEAAKGPGSCNTVSQEFKREPILISGPELFRGLACCSPFPVSLIYHFSNLGILYYLEKMLGHSLCLR